VTGKGQESARKGSPSPLAPLPTGERGKPSSPPTPLPSFAKASSFVETTEDKSEGVPGGEGGKRRSGLHVVCFGGEDWWYHNRGHVDMQLMQRFAARGRVLYVNSIVMRKFNVGEGGMFWRRVRRKVASIRRGMSEEKPGFFVYSPLTLPVHHVWAAARLNQAGLKLQVKRAMRKIGIARPIVWVACPPALETAAAIAGEALVYQRTDRYEEYPGVDSGEIRRMDRELKKRADLTVFVNHALYEAEGAECRRAFLSDHGVDYEFFAEAEKDARMPEEIKALPRPIIGFFGGIDDHTMDVALAAEVARMRPKYSFVFVGSASADLGPFEGLSNARFVGKKAYEEIPHYGKCFDVAIMPWRQNEWIKMCNPVKLKEYLALGKPVVSTPFRELEHYREVAYVARGAEEFAAALDRAIAEDSPERKAARRERVRGHTWDAKAEEVLRAIREAVRTSDR